MGYAVVGAAGLVAVGEFPADRMAGTAADAGSAPGAPRERIVAVGAGVRGQFERRDHGAEPHCDAVGGDQSCGESESAGPGDESDMPF